MLQLLKKLIGLTKKNTEREKLHTDTSAAETENNKDSLTIDRQIIKNTPFTMVGTPKDGYWLTMGKHRLSQAYRTKQEVLVYLKQKDWTLITAVMIAFIHDRKLIDNAYGEKNGKPTEEQLHKMNRVTL